MADKDLLSQLSDMQQQQADAARWEEFLPARRDEDLDAVITSHAVSSTHALAEEADAIREGYLLLRTELAAVRDDAREGRITSADAVRRLASARRASAELDTRSSALASRYSSAKATAADPAGTREALLRKYPSLRG